MEDKYLHGTYRSYNRGCRCDKCKLAGAEKARDNRKRRLERPVPDHLHGQKSTYQNYGCRCDKCRRSMREKERVRRAHEGKETIVGRVTGEVLEDIKAYCEDRLAGSDE